MAFVSSDYLKEHPLLRTRDLDEARAVMSHHWAKHTVVPTTAIPFETTVNYTEFGKLGLTFVRCPTPLRVTSSPMDGVYQLFLLEDGSCEFTLNGKVAVAHSRTGVVVLPGQSVDMKTEAVRSLALDIPHRLVEERLASRELARKDLASQAISCDLRTGAGLTLKSLLHWTVQQLDRNGSVLSSGRAASELSHALVTLYVDCIALPHQSKENAQIGRVRLSDLEDYVIAHLPEPLTADSLARFAGVSTRAVQAAFRRHFDCTPTQFIRLRRLELVRERLENARPGTDISNIAMDLGFFQLGDFSRYYREQFGERPSDTLRRALRGKLPKSDPGRR